jgi:hypothetical protein
MPRSKKRSGHGAYERANEGYMSARSDLVIGIAVTAT